MKYILTLLLTIIPTLAWGQCVGTISSISKDDKRGTIIVETSYALNGINVQSNGRVRYSETNPQTDLTWTLLELKQMVGFDIKDHCENLIARMPTNESFIQTTVLERQGELVQTLIDNVQNQVGQKISATEKVISYKGKTITVRADGTTSISNIIP